jgi:hypothetical protein
MGRILLSSHDEAVADFLTDYLDLDDSLLLVHIIENPIVAEP